MKKVLSKAVAIAGIAVSLMACADHDIRSSGFDCSAQSEISFAGDVQPIVASNCAISGCHDGSLGEERNWTIFPRFQAKASSVRDRITRAPGTPGHMPASGSLTQSEIRTIVCWVEQGALNN